MGKLSLHRSRVFSKSTGIWFKNFLIVVFSFTVLCTSFSCDSLQSATTASAASTQALATKYPMNTPTPAITPTPKETLSPEEVDFGLSNERLKESYIVENVLFLDLDINGANIFALGLFDVDPESSEVTISYFFRENENLFTMKEEDFGNSFTETIPPSSYKVCMTEISDDNVLINGVTVLPGLEYYFYSAGKPLNSNMLQGPVSVPGSLMSAAEIEQWYRNSISRDCWFVPSEYADTKADNSTVTPPVTVTPTITPEDIDFGMSSDRLGESYTIEDVFFIDFDINGKSVYTLGLQVNDPETDKTTIYYFFNTTKALLSMDTADFIDFFNNPSTSVKYSVDMPELSDDNVKLNGITVLPGLGYYLGECNIPCKAGVVNDKILNPDTIMTAGEIEQWFKDSFYLENLFIPSEYENTK